MVACAKLANAELPTDRKLDGHDPLPVLTRKEKSPHDSLYFVFRNHAALRMGDWKIVRTKKTEPWKLYNLADDIGETNDLAKSHPERLAVLTEGFQSWE
jgi:arylsulfatase A-like enzyme